MIASGGRAPGDQNTHSRVFINLFKNSSALCLIEDADGPHLKLNNMVAFANENSSIAFAGVKPLPGFLLVLPVTSENISYSVSLCWAGFSDQALDSAFEVDEVPL